MKAEPLSAATREACLALRVHEHQQQFVGGVDEYLTMCEGFGVWQPLALVDGEEVIGFAMWALDPEEGSHWLGGILIDAAHQGRGLGRAAMEALLEYVRAQPGCRELALSYDADNTVARRLYASLGFRETGEVADGELVARRPCASR